MPSEGARSIPNPSQAVSGLSTVSLKDSEVQARTQQQRAPLKGSSCQVTTGLLLLLYSHWILLLNFDILSYIQRIYFSAYTACFFQSSCFYFSSWSFHSYFFPSSCMFPSWQWLDLDRVRLEGQGCQDGAKFVLNKDQGVSRILLTHRHMFQVDF